MAECWQNLQETRKHQEIVLQDGLVMLIQAEHDQRAANKTARLIKNARFRYDASIEQVLFDPAKGRDQGRIMCTLSISLVFFFICLSLIILHINGHPWRHPLRPTFLMSISIRVNSAVSAILFVMIISIVV